jgi:hypothetical protein
MSISLSIPLSGQYSKVRGYYIQPISNFVYEDITPDYRLLGYISGSYSVNGIINFTPETIFIQAIETTIPAYRNSLVSASLSFNFVTGLPLIFNQDTRQIYKDWRQDLVDSFTTRANIPIHKTTNSGNFFSVSSYDNIKLSDKYAVSSQTINPGSNNVSITNSLSSNVNNPSWSKNNKVTIFISGVKTSSSPGGLIDVSTLTLNLVYNPVVPFQPTSVIASEAEYRQVSLNWQPPQDNGGDSISSYSIQYGILSGTNNYISKWTDIATSTTNSVTLNNLILDTTYSFRVLAINSVGSGEYSSQSLPITISRSQAPVTALNYNDANYTRIRLRRATASEWSGVNPVLGLGEAGYELDTRYIKVGNGAHTWNSLDYVKVPSSSIVFPNPPDINLTIGSSKFNLPNNNRIIVNLSSGNRLNIVGEEGVAVNYSDSYKAITISSEKLYNPISSGTIYNPSSSGTPGSLLYDNTWLYFCTNTNYWQRTPIDKTWIDFSQYTISNTGGSYPSITNIIFDRNILGINTDGDPYPALAGRPLVNDGTTARGGFYQNSLIREKDHRFILNYRGGTNTSDPHPINSVSGHGVLFNGTVVFSVSAGTGSLPGFISAPSGFTYNASTNRNFFSADDCGGYTDTNGIYRYRDGRFLKNCWSTEKVHQANDYYNNSHYSGDHFRHTNGHSKLIGFCFDGYPIYGPFSYDDPMNTGSSITLMRSSYSGIITDDHRPVNWKYWNTIAVGDIQYSIPQGTFLQDYTYTTNYGHLDQYNGRFAITPEFPSGTYAYYLTFEDNNLSIPTFPYIFGTGTKQQRAQQASV